MNSPIAAKEFLKVLFNNGYEAYLCGDYILSDILGDGPDEIMIATAASYKDLSHLFDEVKPAPFDHHLAIVKYQEHQFKIYFFQDDLKTLPRRRQEHYSWTLISGLGNCQFASDAVVMTANAATFDLYGGVRDIRKRKLRMFGPTSRMKDDPLMILRALVYVSERNFKPTPKVIRAMRRGAKSLKHLTQTEREYYLERIVSGPHFRKALDLLIYTNGYKHLPERPAFEALSKRFETLSYPLFKVLLAQLTNEPTVDYPDPDGRLDQVMKLIAATPKAKFSMLQLFTFKPELCIAANKVLYILKKAPRRYKRIKKQYEKLPIKRKCDLAFKGEDILKLTNGRDGEYLHELIDAILYQVLKGQLRNEFYSIRDFVKIELRSLNIPVTMLDDYESQYNYEEESLDDFADLDMNLVFHDLLIAKSPDDIREAIDNQIKVLKDYLNTLLTQGLVRDYEFIREQRSRYEIMINSLATNYITVLIEQKFYKLTPTARQTIIDNIHRDYLTLVREFENQIKGEKHE